MKALQKLKDDLFRFRYGLLAAGGWIVLTQILFGASCPIRLLFGLPCPGCGLTRAFVLLVTGHPLQSLRAHPLLLPMLLFLVLLVIGRYFEEKVLRFLPICGIILIVVFLGVYAYRMLTEFPEGEVMRFYPDGMILTKIKQLLSLTEA